jgi:putative transposase
MGYIAINSIIQWINHETDETIYKRVLWIDNSQDKIVLFRLSHDIDNNFYPEIHRLSDIHNLLSDEVAIIRPIDNFERRFALSDERVIKHIPDRDKSWEFIKEAVRDEPDIFDKKLRGVMVREIMDKHGVTNKTVYRLFRKYWTYGKTKNALFPLFENFGAPGKSRVITEEMIEEAEAKGEKIPKRGRKRFVLQADPSLEGINIDKKTEKLILQVINHYYKSEQKPTLAGAHRYLKRHYYNVGYKVVNGEEVPIIDPERKYPSLAQFKYVYYKNRDLQEILIGREGEKGFHLRNRPVFKTSTDNKKMGPGSVYQIDSTVLSVHLVNRHDRTRNIGKVIIYLVMDVFTRKIVGRYIGLIDPSWESARMAILDSFLNPKSKNQEDNNLLDKLCYLPEVILTDKGTEFTSYNSDNLAAAFDITVTNTASFRADWKGIVEQAFNKLRERLRNIPGSVKKGYRERQVKDHREETGLDIKQLTKIVDAIIDHHNSHILQDYDLDEDMIRDDVLPTSNELWDWGIQHRGGNLRQISSQQAMFHLLPTKMATVTPKGIRLGRRFYTFELAEQWGVEAKEYGSWKVNAAYNKRDLEHIYLFLENGQKIQKCSLRPNERKYLKYIEEEANDIHVRTKVKIDLQESNENDSDSYLDTVIESTVNEGIEMTLKAHQEKGEPMGTKKYSNVKENREQEKERHIQEHQWILVEEDKDMSTNQQISQFIVEEDEKVLQPRYSKQASLLSKLKKR